MTGVLLTIHSLQSTDQTQQTQGADWSTASTNRVPTGFCFKIPYPFPFFQKRSKDGEEEAERVRERTYDSSEKLVVSDDDEPFMPNAFCGSTTCSRGT